MFHKHLFTAAALLFAGLACISALPLEAQNENKIRCESFCKRQWRACRDRATTKDTAKKEKILKICDTRMMECQRRCARYAE